MLNEKIAWKRRLPRCLRSMLGVHTRGLSNNTLLRRLLGRISHSTYQKVVQGKCPLHFLHFNGAVCSNTLFSNTSALTNSLLFRANSTFARFSNTSFGRTLLGSNFGGLLLEQTFCRHFAWCDTPLCDTISKGYCEIGGGVSDTGPQRRQRSGPLQRDRRQCSCDTPLHRDTLSATPL